jgi:hypothetical protein
MNKPTSIAEEMARKERARQHHLLLVAIQRACQLDDINILMSLTLTPFLECIEIFDPEPEALTLTQLHARFAIHRTETLRALAIASLARYPGNSVNCLPEIANLLGLDFYADYAKDKAFDLL